MSPAIGAADDDVGARVAVDRVDAAAAGEAVGAGVADERVALAGALEVVGLVVGGDAVDPVRADDVLDVDEVVVLPRDAVADGVVERHDDADDALVRVGHRVRAVAAVELVGLAVAAEAVVARRAGDVLDVDEVVVLARRPVVRDPVQRHGDRGELRGVGHEVAPVAPVELVGVVVAAEAVVAGRAGHLLEVDEVVVLPRRPVVVDVVQRHVHRHGELVDVGHGIQPGAAVEPVGLSVADEVVRARGAGRVLDVDEHVELAGRPVVDDAVERHVDGLRSAVVVEDGVRPAAAVEAVGGRRRLAREEVVAVGARDVLDVEEVVALREAGRAVVGEIVEARGDRRRAAVGVGHGVARAAGPVEAVRGQAPVAGERVVGARADDVLDVDEVVALRDAADAVVARAGVRERHRHRGDLVRVGHRVRAEPALDAVGGARRGPREVVAGSPARDVLDVDEVVALPERAVVAGDRVLERHRHRRDAVGVRDRIGAGAAAEDVRDGRRLAGERVVAGAARHVLDLEEVVVLGGLAVVGGIVERHRHVGRPVEIGDLVRATASGEDVAGPVADERVVAEVPDGVLEVRRGVRRHRRERRRAEAHDDVGVADARIGQHVAIVARASPVEAVALGGGLDDGVGARVAVDVVDPAVAAQHVVAGPSGDGVAAAAAGDLVSIRVADEVVDAAAADERVAVGPSGHGHGPG